jgi:NitT/TauT family transport system permease protein
MAAEISVAILGGFGIGHLLHHGPELQAMDQLVGQMRVMAAIGFLGDELIFYP